MEALWKDDPDDDSKNERHSSTPGNHMSNDATGLHASYLDDGITRRSLAVWSRVLPMDDTRAPNLAAKSLDLQTREVFNMLVSTILFPATYAAFYKRVDQDIIAFVRDDRRAQCPAMEWVVRCYATWYYSKQHDDRAKREESRYIYGVLLQYLQALLDDPKKRRTDITFTISILLAMYEAFDGTKPDGWLIHIKGIKELLRQRGAEVHLKGFSRTVFLACRGFFVAEAFANRESCILADPDWVDVNARAFEREERAGRGSRLLSIIDRSYREVVQAPGLVAQARTIADADMDPSERGELGRDELRVKIQANRHSLRKLRRRLTTASELAVTPGPVASVHEPLLDPGYIGLIARYTLEGLCTVEGLLQQAYNMLETTEMEGVRGAVSLSTARDRSNASSGCLDDILLSMGAMTIWTNQ